MERPKPLSRRVIQENVNNDLIDRLNMLKEEYNTFNSKKKNLKDHDSVLKE